MMAVSPAAAGGIERGLMISISNRGTSRIRGTMYRSKLSDAMSLAPISTCSNNAMPIPQIRFPSICASS